MSDTKPTRTLDRHWRVYAPSKEAPWDLRRVVHLHRRAGNACTWAELQRDLKDGPRASINRLLAGKARSQGVPQTFEETARVLADAVAASHDPRLPDSGRLEAWWVYRMLFGPDPLTERLVLMWHDHFATSNEKVKDLTAMRRQNEVFREFARAPFGQLLERMVRDPALLVWLDAEVKRKEHPNENLARELMELFTLGVGHYTEKDVKEAARILTGWSVVQGEFRAVPRWHDAGEKVVLGQRGCWDTKDLVRLLLEQPATAERLAGRVCGLFLGEGAVAAAGVKTLAAGLRERDLDIRWAVETVLRSETFFAQTNLRTRILGPVEYVLGPVRMLELFETPPSTRLLAAWMARLGQQLFHPPTVFGWPGGRSWITTQTMIDRCNYAAALVKGALCRRPAPVDVLALARRHGRGASLEDVISFYGELMHGTSPDRKHRARLLAALGVKGAATAENVRRAVAQMVASPEAQLA